MDDIRRIFEHENRIAKLLEEAMAPSEALRRQLDKLLEPSPSMKAIQKMMADIQASPAHENLAKQIERINQIGEPLRKRMESISRLHDSALEATRLASEALPTRINDPEPVHFAPAVPIFQPPEPLKSPAGKMLETIGDHLAAERAEKEDQRHTVLLIVYLPDQSAIIVERMSTEDGQVIHIEGKDADSKQPRMTNVGALAFQYDFITIEHRPNLHTVE